MLLSIKLISTSVGKGMSTCYVIYEEKGGKYEQNGGYPKGGGMK